MLISSTVIINEHYDYIDDGDCARGRFLPHMSEPCTVLPYQQTPLNQRSPPRLTLTSYQLGPSKDSPHPQTSLIGRGNLNQKKTLLTEAR